MTEIRSYPAVCQRCQQQHTFYIPDGAPGTVTRLSVPCACGDQIIARVTFPKPIPKPLPGAFRRARAMLRRK